jgi:hypothetical protein
MRKVGRKKKMQWEEGEVLPASEARYVGQIQAQIEVVE